MGVIVYEMNAESVRPFTLSARCRTVGELDNVQSAHTFMKQTGQTSHLKCLLVARVSRRLGQLISHATL